MAKMKDSRSRLASRDRGDDSWDGGVTQPDAHLVERSPSPETPTTPGVPPGTNEMVQLVQSKASLTVEDTDSQPGVSEEGSQSKLPSPRDQSPSGMESVSASDSGVQTEAATLIQVRHDVAA